MGTGSEVSLCVAAAEQLAASGTPVRIVSMPSWELFEQQDHRAEAGELLYRLVNPWRPVDLRELSSRWPVTYRRELPLRPCTVTVKATG